jgi:hypothetical protein
LIAQGELALLRNQMVLNSRKAGSKLRPAAWRAKADIRFAPKATRLLRNSEMTR